MQILEFKLIANPEQILKLTEALRTFQFIRNKALGLWMDDPAKRAYDLNVYCAVLAKEYAFVQAMNSQARQAAANRQKARNCLARKHLKVQRQRKDFAIKPARCVVKSNDFVAIKDLSIKNMVKNHCLAKSISDAAWSMFFGWLVYYGFVFGKPVIKVPPAYTSQDCSSCGTRVKKSLSTRTHVCQYGCVFDRDLNAALNILVKGLALISLIYSPYPGALGNGEGLPSATLLEREPLLVS